MSSLVRQLVAEKIRPPVTQMIARIETPLYDRFTAYLAEHGLTMQEYLRAVVINTLDEAGYSTTVLRD